MIRTRMAPSPTGLLHVGNARVAVLNWLYTRHMGGAFVLRIEDTDVERNVDTSENAIYEDLHWLGIDPDEGPIHGGRFGPYRQTERLASYAAQAEHFVDIGAAYPCFCTKAELDAERDAAVAAGHNPHYSGRCRRLSHEQRQSFRDEGREFALRFAVPADHAIIFDDMVHGTVSVNSAEIGDFIIVRSDGMPTYNFAVVCDDIAMRITHVIRGNGHLSNTPRQVLMFNAFNATLPVFAHVPTVLGADRQKLSKRNGAQSISDYRENGYHPDALVNYLSLLSWSSPNGDEFLTRDQLVEQISLDRLGASDVVFDPAKLRWLSGKHIETMSLDDLKEAVRPFLDDRYSKMDDATYDVALGAVRSHLVTFAEINDALAPLFISPDNPGSTMPGSTTAGSASSTASFDDAQTRVIAAAAATLSDVDWSEAGLQQALKQIGSSAGAKGRALYEPLRRAITGQEHGPPFVPLLLVRGREDVLRRINNSLLHNSTS
jgi:glutamyl-tRNA synthetase